MAEEAHTVENLQWAQGASAGAVAAAREIAAAAEEADGRPPVSDQALLAMTAGQRELLLFSIDAGPDSEPVAFGIVGAGEVDLVGSPEWRGRGIGSTALTVLLERAGQNTALLAWSHGENPAADALLARAGFAPVRSLYRMALDPVRLPVADGGLASVTLPEGFALRSFNPSSPVDAREWVRVNAAAFASHPEQGRITEEDFAGMRDEPWFDPADLLLLEGPTGTVGYTWVKTVHGDGPLASPRTELYAIGVEPSAAGSGFGKILLEATLARMAEHSPSSVELYVDGENARAVGMYERAGFTIASRSRQWLRTA